MSQSLQSSNTDSSKSFPEPSVGPAVAQDKLVTKPSISFPSSVTEKILWSPSFQDLTSTSDLPKGQPHSDNAATTISPPTFTFPDGILSEVQAATCCAFSCAVQRAGVDAHSSFSDSNDKQSTKSLVEPVISLYYPHDGCNDIIDSLVKSLAREQRADVVVLDSLELALEEFGAFGKEVADAINKPYRDPCVSDDEPKKDCSNDLANSRDAEAHTIQKMFNDIVDIRREPDALQGKSSTIEQTKSRIIYMRDFGRIAPSAMPLVPYLLQALRTRRTSTFGSLDSERPFQPTVLILGFAETNAGPKGDCDDDDPDMYKCCCRICRSRREVNAQHIPLEFAKGGAALLPSLDNKRFTLRKEPLPWLLSPLSATFFLKSLADPGELRTNTAPPNSNVTSKSKSTPLDDLTSIAISLSVFPKESSSDGFWQVEQHMEWRRRQEVQNAWMVVCLGRRGAVTSENPLGSIQDHDITTSAAAEEHTPHPQDMPKAVALLDGLCKRTGILLPVALDRIAAIALGLSLSQPSGLEATVEVTPTAISRAYQLFIENWQARSDWMKIVNKNKKEIEKKVDGGKEGDTLLDPIVKKVKESQDLNSYERELLGCIVDGGKLATTFEDVCIPSKIINSLRTIISLPLLHPAAFKIGILGREAIGGILLYGPPGTGKTLVCRALARECGARMLQVKPSDIMDCFVGESEKLAKGIFTLAYQLAPCVIFIDEMDALFRARTGKDDRQYYRNILNEFLQSMDGLQSAKKNKDAGIVVVGATNRPHDLDDAVLRRLPTRMMVDLPNEKERKQILHLHLRNEKLNEDVNLGNIAQKTHYYSGSDLKNLCVSAAMESVKEAVGDFSWTRRTPLNSNADTSDKNEAPVVTNGTESTIQARTITQAHFTHAINEVSASSSADSHSELYRWHVQFGRKRTQDDNSNGRSQTNGRSGSGYEFKGTGSSSYGSRVGNFGGSTNNYGWGRGAYCGPGNVS